MSSITRWPLTEQPRGRLLSRGAETLTDGELLAVVLGTSTRQAGGVLSTSRDLLLRFGGLRGVVRSHPGALMTVSGIGEARACALVAVLELARRLQNSDAVRGRVVRSSHDAYELVRSRLVMQDQEVFLVVALDAKHRALGIHQVAQGTATFVEVHPREVFSPVVREAAAAVIVAHNHPSGDPDPSAEDQHLTNRLAQAGDIMGIPLLDHLVVGAGRYVSLADRGLL